MGGGWHAFRGFGFALTDFFLFLGSLGKGGEGTEDGGPLVVLDIVSDVVHVAR